MRVLFISQYFPPEMGAPAARTYDLARRWVQQGRRGHRRHRGAEPPHRRRPRALPPRHVLFAGLDVIVGKLIEINVTSPTLVQELKRFSGADLPKAFWDKVEAML